MDSAKSPGQINYEGYRDSIRVLDTAPCNLGDWNELTNEARASWDAGAAHVQVHYAKRARAEKLRQWQREIDAARRLALDSGG